MMEIVGAIIGSGIVINAMIVLIWMELRDIHYVLKNRQPVTLKPTD